MNRGLRIVLASGLIASASLLAACGGSGGGGLDVPPPPPPVGLIDSFGAGFAAAFRAAITGDPRDPAAGDIIALTLTADAVPIP